jgi:hypothetical protein
VDVVVDLPGGRVGLAGWEQLTSLSVRVVGGPAGGPDTTSEERLTAVLLGAGVARMDGQGDALLPPEVLRGLAAAAASAEGRGLAAAWDEGFAGMLAYAAGQGWTEGDGTVRAHVEWRDV